ncbi:MAG TPA: O-antigen ligase family protein [Methylomirabilota bacterium]|nr:O-antigen ligase family protein [Methylomirabilota bacterium]
MLLGAFVLGLGTSITLSEAALGALALLWLVSLRRPDARAAARWPLAGPLLAFAAASLVSVLASPSPLQALDAGRGLWLVLALYVTANALPDGRAAGRFLTGLALVCLVGAAVGLAQVAACPGSAPNDWSPAWLYHRCSRARGLFSIYMTLGGVLMLVLLATLPRLLPGTPRARALPLAWATLLAGLVATYVRGAWLGFGAGVISVAALWRRGRWLVVGGLIVLVGLGLLGPYELRQRLAKMTDPQEAGLKERVYMWRSGVAMWLPHPWLGVGPGGVKREFPRHALPEAAKQRTGHLHSAPLQILVERGLIGFAAWLWIWVAFYRRVGAMLGPTRANPPDHAVVVGALAAVTGFLVHGLTEYNFGDAEVMLVLWVLMALPFTLDGRGAERGRPAVTGVSTKDPSPTAP